MASGAPDVVNVVSLPVAFVLVMLGVVGRPPSGASAQGVAAAPMLLVWQITAVGSILLLVGLAFNRLRRPAS